MICLVEAKAQGQQKASDVYVAKSRSVSWEEERREKSKKHEYQLSGLVRGESFRLNGYKLLSRL